MPKSVNDYYSEKMKRLLEMQEQKDRQMNAGRLSSPTARGASGGKATGAPRGENDGRGYYDDFRKKVGDKRGHKSSDGHIRVQKSIAGAPPTKKRPQNPLERTVVDDIREGRAPSKNHYRGNTKRDDPSEKKEDGAKRRRISPEQTARDKYEENLRKMEAMRLAKRARVLRKIRDAAISCALIAAVFIVMCVVVYRLLFVIKDISVGGNVANTSDELVLASGVEEGDHLFSFSSREVGELMILRCPEVSAVDVERTPPGTIVFNVTEEDPRFFADFYGEYRLMSESLRVLDSVTEEDARAQGCIKIKLPDIKEATAGLVPEFSSVRNDDYIFGVCKTLMESPLGERATSLDLSDKFNITLGVEGKYLIRFGDSESMDTKMKIASAVLEDEMFSGETKATVDVTDLSETSVVVDEGLFVE